METWTLEQEAKIQQIMKDKGVSHVAAARRFQIELNAAKRATKITQPKELNKVLRKLGNKAPHIANAKKTKATKAKTERKSKYDKAKVIHLFIEGGKTVKEISESKLPGVVGISPVFAHRILFGTENSGGVNPEQQARRKEKAARVNAWAAAREAKAKE